MPRRIRVGKLNVDMTELTLVPTTRYTRRRRIFKLKEQFYLKIEGNPVGVTALVPKGFETDLASIPLVCQVIVGSATRYAEAAIVHDSLCEAGWPRDTANSIFRIMLEATGHRYWRRLLLYWGVQVFGYGSVFCRAYGAIRQFFSIKT